MSLAEVQNLLARLYTDEILRERFFTEPAIVGAEFLLDEKEISELTALAKTELNFFADSLFYKRLREVEKLLPLSKKVLNRDFEKLFRDFSKTFNPRSIKKHLEDAIEFADFLFSQTRQPTWLADLIKFEAAKLQFHGEGRRFVLRSFRHDIRRISTAVEKPDADDQKMSFEPRKTRAAWIRVWGKTHYFVW